ncbi:transport protein particle (TRAPP) component [Artemisia annua]|uniref:Transport protein particle (TRAPP) component n=1 Tax=Artemisia annua TaxID=35608 RepID=A0A2U1NZB0_ARTAN|nr:transport protein particle (TRAPP) component [Artemisia annua]
MAPAVPRSGDAIFANVERVNAELFTLTYGAIVRQLLTDLEEVEEVNKQLDQMGYNIGIRLIDSNEEEKVVNKCIYFWPVWFVDGFRLGFGFKCKVVDYDLDLKKNVRVEVVGPTAFVKRYVYRWGLCMVGSVIMAPAVPRSGDAIFANVERVNAELFTLTYGAIVRQLLTDLEEVEEVNKQLDQMGYNIGIRLIDEFLAKSNVTRCVDFRETAEVIAKVGFKMFLGVTASVTNWDSEGTCCSLILEDNPLVDFVELPDTCQGLYYCNILSGVVRGALEMVSMKTEITWIRDMLRGDDAFELQVKLLKQIPEEYPYKDDE